MSKPKTITVDGTKYIEEGAERQAPAGPVKIVVLQRGWVLVGRYSENGDRCALDSASVIRAWGTTRGLGEIADGGPTASTKLDPCGHVDFHVLTTVLVLNCREDKWSL